MQKENWLKFVTGGTASDFVCPSQVFVYSIHNFLTITYFGPSNSLSAVSRAATKKNKAPVFIKVHISVGETDDICQWTLSSCEGTFDAQYKV